jgi:HNH endonuclease
MQMPNKHVPVFERIMRRTLIDPETGCWECDLGRQRLGYTRVAVKVADDYFGRTGTFAAHRVVYTLLVGPVPDELVMDHLCRNPSCVNPAHLEPTTNYQNVVARTTLGGSAVNARKELCDRGHALAGANLVLAKDGHRNCRLCKLISQRARYGEKHRAYAREWYRRNRAKRRPVA